MEQASTSASSSRAPMASERGVLPTRITDARVPGRGQSPTPRSWPSSPIFPVHAGPGVPRRRQRGRGLVRCSHVGIFAPVPPSRTVTGRGGVRFSASGRSDCARRCERIVQTSAVRTFRIWPRRIGEAPRVVMAPEMESRGHGSPLCRITKVKPRPGRC